MKNEEIIFAAISIIAGLVVLSTLVWAFVKYPSEEVVGERFVKDEIQVLPINSDLFHLKPITILIISAFVFWICGLEYLRTRLMILPLPIKRLMFIFFAVIVFVFSFEFIWNFLFWASSHVITPSIPIDLLYHKLDPFMFHPRNFSYATKLSTFYVAMGLYSIYFFNQIMKRKESSA